MRRLSIPLSLCAAVAAGAACSTDPVTPPAVIQIVQDPGLSGDGQVAQVGTQLALPLRVLVTSNSQPAPGIAVQWAVSPGNGSIGATGTTNDNGIATTLWTMPLSSGIQAATATLAGANGSPVGFTATALPAPADTFLIVTGNNQTFAVNTQAGEPLVVRVLDEYGNSVPGVTITWSVFSGSATLSATSTNTSGGGTASVTVTGGSTSGAVVVRAIPTAALPALDFNLTVVP